MRIAGRLVALLAAACTAGVALAVPAQAAERRVVPGSTTLDDRTSLTYVPCGGFFGAATAPGMRINRGPEAAPLGRRSFGMAVSGAGTAAGAVHRTMSMGSLGPVSMAVNPTAGTSTGVAYAWYASADLPAGQAWLGRADLAAAPGWQRVDVSGSSFTWQAYDLGSRQPQGEATTASLPEFVGAHGDGPGYVVAGFGCNGVSFNLDALAYGGSTYDLEGFAATTTIAVEGGGGNGPVTLRGWSERDTGLRLGDPLVLERLVPGTSTWEAVTGPLFADADAAVRTTVSPEVPTHYRWRMLDSEYADTNVSQPVLIEPVVAAEPAPEGEGQQQHAPQGEGQQQDAPQGEGHQQEDAPNGEGQQQENAPNGEGQQQP